MDWLTNRSAACVASVSGESDTNNNCSDGVSVTVSSSSSGGGGGSLGACRAGLVVNPNESCTYKSIENVEAFSFAPGYPAHPYITG